MKPGPLDDIVRLEVLHANDEYGADANMSSGERSAYVFCAGVAIVIASALMASLAGLFQFTSEVGTLIVLRKTQCHESVAAQGRLCFKVTAQRPVELPNNGSVAVRLLASDGWYASRLVKFRVRSAGTAPCLEIAAADLGMGAARTELHASLVGRSRVTSALEVLSEGWRRVLVGGERS